MYKKPYKVDICRVQFQTSQKRSYITGLMRIINDVDKKKRLKNQECVVCFYGSKIGGCSITETECGICGTELNFSSTNTDDLCKPCADQHKLCRHCSADINLKKRRKL